MLSTMLTFLPSLIFYSSLSRIENHCQRTSESLQDVVRSDNIDMLLPDGICLVRTANLHGNVEAEVCERHFQLHRYTI